MEYLIMDKDIIDLVDIKLKHKERCLCSLHWNYVIDTVKKLASPIYYIRVYWSIYGQWVIRYIKILPVVKLEYIILGW